MKLLEEYKQLSKTNNDLKINFDPINKLYTIKYLHSGVNWNNYLYLIARGLVLDENSNVIIHPYNKFFNLGELQLDHYSNLLSSVRNLSKWNPNKKIINISEKIDGTLLCIRRTTKYGVIISTTGNTDPNTQIIKRVNQFIGKNGIDKYINKLPTNLFFIFEFYDSSAPLAYSYGNSSLLYLHGIRNVDTGCLDTYESINKKYNELFYECPKIKMCKDYSSYTEKQLLELAKTAQGMEGFVVTFEDGQMLKIKTKEYLTLKKSVSLLFGSPATVNKTKLIIGKYLDDELDDIYGLLGITTEDNKRKQLEEYIKLVMKVMDNLKLAVKQYLPYYTEIINNKDKRIKFFTLGGNKKINTWYKNVVFSLASNNQVNTKMSETDIIKAWFNTEIPNKQIKEIIKLTGFKEL